MTEIRDEIVSLILSERRRHYDLPGSEYDSIHTPNDWVALITHYCSEVVSYKGTKPDSEEFRDSLIKAAAIILAALEKTQLMKDKGLLT